MAIIPINNETELTIEQAIKTNETTHVGEMSFVLQGALDGMPLFTGQPAFPA